MKNYRFSTEAAVAGDPDDFTVATGDLLLPGPVETLTSAGLRSRPPSKKPRRIS